MFACILVAWLPRPGCEQGCGATGCRGSPGCRVTAAPQQVMQRQTITSAAKFASPSAQRSAQTLLSRAQRVRIGRRERERSEVVCLHPCCVGDASVPQTSCGAMGGDERVDETTGSQKRDSRYVPVSHWD